jgi:DNA-binding protein YbaB
MSDNSIEQAEPEATEEFYRREFSVYNPSGSVGISCNGRGQICGLTLDEDALTSDEELANEIVALAKLARAKYRMHLRLFSLEATTAQGRDPDRMDRFYRGVQKLPTPEEYAAMERADAARYAQ